MVLYTPPKPPDRIHVVDVSRRDADVVGEIRKACREAGFFSVSYSPDPYARIECLPTCTSAELPPKHPPCAAVEHLDEMFRRAYRRATAPSPHELKIGVVAGGRIPDPGAAARAR